MAIVGYCGCGELQHGACGDRVIEVRHLRYFLAVAECGSLRKAADRIYVAQSSLTRSVQTLERDLGATLFERGARGVKLTSAGQGLLEPARSILHDVDALRSRLSAPSSEISGRVVLGASAGGARLLFGCVAERIRREHPGIELALVEGLQYSLLEGLDTGRIDLAMLVDADVSSRIEVSLIAREAAYLIGRDDNITMPDTRCLVTDLAALPLVLYPERTGSRLLLERIARDHGVRLDVPYEVESQEVLRDFVARGLGFGVVPYSSMVRARAATGTLRSVPVVGVEFRRDLAWRADRPVRPAVAIVSSAIASEARRLVDSGDLAPCPPSVRGSPTVPTGRRGLTVRQ